MNESEERAPRGLVIVADGVGGLEWREDPDPVIDAPTDALVRPTAVSTCDLDQEIIKRSVPGSEQPFAIGHEGAGEVVERKYDITLNATNDVSGGAMRDCLPPSPRKTI